MSIRRRTVVLGSTTALIAAAAAVSATMAAGSTPSHRPAPAANATTAYLSGYDVTTRRVRFQLARWVGGGLDDGHFELVPGTRSLPLAPALTVRSAVVLCSAGQLTIDAHGDGTKACTAGQLVAGLSAGHRPSPRWGRRPGGSTRSSSGTSPERASPRHEGDGGGTSGGMDQAAASTSSAGSGARTVIGVAARWPRISSAATALATRTAAPTYTAGMVPST